MKRSGYGVKVKVELNDLAKKIERGLTEYNVEGTSGALILDIDLSVMLANGSWVVYVQEQLLGVAGKAALPYVRESLTQLVLSHVWGSALPPANFY